MNRSRVRNALRAGLVGCVLCAALAVAASAPAVPLPSPGSYAGLPPGWVLQQSWNAQPVRSISFVSNSTGFCLDMSNELLKTTDGGVTWNVVGMPATPWDIYSVSFVSPSVGFACGDDSTVYKTVDGGSTWATQTANPNTQAGSSMRAIQAVDANHVYAVGTSLLVLGTTNGSTWATQTLDGATTGTGQLFALHMTDATHGWAAGAEVDGSGLMLGRNPVNGHWVAEATGQLGNRWLSSVWFTDALHGWTTGDNMPGDTATLYATSDGGAHWAVKSSAPTTQDPTAIAFLDNNHGFMGCNFNADQGATLLETTDGGANWTAYNPDPPGFAGGAMILAFAKTDANHLWAGGGFGVEDPAAVWSLQLAKPGTKQRLGAPVIDPQFPSKPFTFEDHDWLKAVGSLAPKHNGSWPIRIVAEKRVGKKWVAKFSANASLSKSGWSYSAWIKFPSTGSWRIRAVHSAGSGRVASGYTYYKVIVDDWDNP